jgi:neutral ceramidase
MKRTGISIIKGFTMNKFILKWIIFIFFILLSWGSLYAKTPDDLSNKQDQKFRAAVVKVDITPADSQMLLGYNARKSTGVHDQIYHRILAMDDGTTQFYLVSTEICEYSPSEYDRVAALLKSELGIEPINFLWTVTHTHSAPEVGPPGLGEVFLGDRYKHQFDVAYRDMITQKLINGIREARQKLAPAKLGVGWGFSQANINRRAVDVEGQASLGLNPDGATDRRIGMIRIDHADGTPMALIANYPIHGTVLGPKNLRISGDAPGIVADYVEQKTGVPCLFINGALGNLAPIYSVYDSPQAGHLGQFRVLLGDRILEANKKILYTTDAVKLHVSSIVVETPRRPDMGWTEDLKAYTRTTPSGEHMIRLPVRFLKINEDIAIWGAPIELFCEISNEIRDRSPFPYTFYFGLSNGWLGYLLTEKEYGYDGYEPRVSPYISRAEKDLKEAVITYLQGELNSVQLGHK